VNFWSNGKVMISIIAPGSHIHAFRLQLDPNTLSQYGKLVNYSGQGVEKINDDIKKFINQKQTNMMLQLTH
jgi:hypothetical protein